MMEVILYDMTKKIWRTLWLYKCDTGRVADSAQWVFWSSTRARQIEGGHFDIGNQLQRQIWRNRKIKQSTGNDQCRIKGEKGSGLCAIGRKGERSSRTCNYWDPAFLHVKSKTFRSSQLNHLLGEQSWCAVSWPVIFRFNRWKNATFTFTSYYNFTVIATLYVTTQLCRTCHKPLN